MSNDGKSKPRPVKGANEGCETEKAGFHHLMTTFTLPGNCDPMKGQDNIIADIGSLPQAAALLARIQDFEKENKLPRGSILRNGVHCFSDKIALQGKKHFDIFNFPPNTVNETSFEVGKGKDGSFHMLNPCMNLVYKTTPIAMLCTKLIDRFQLDHRLVNTIMFDKLPFKYASNIFKGKTAGSKIPLPDCLNVDEDDEDARRKFMELLQQRNQLVVLVINHFNSKGGNGGSATSAASSSSTPSATTSQDGGSSTVIEFGAWAREFVIGHPDFDNPDVLVNQCCHSHHILKQMATPEVKLQFISSIFESFRGTRTKESDDLGLVLNGVFRMFKDGVVLPQCMPKGTAEYDGWLAKLPQRVENGTEGHEKWLAKILQRVEKGTKEKEK